MLLKKIPYIRLVKLFVLCLHFLIKDCFKYKTFNTIIIRGIFCNESRFISLKWAKLLLQALLYFYFKLQKFFKQLNN